MVDVYFEGVAKGGERPGVVFAGPVTREIGRGYVCDCFCIYTYDLSFLLE